MAEASDVKFGMLLGFAKADHRITPRRKRDRSPWLRELTKICVYLLMSNSVKSLGLLGPIIKSHRKTKVGVTLVLELSKTWGFLLIFLQWLKLAIKTWHTAA